MSLFCCVLFVTYLFNDSFLAVSLPLVAVIDLFQVLTLRSSFHSLLPWHPENAHPWNPLSTTVALFIYKIEMSKLIPCQEDVLNRP